MQEDLSVCRREVESLNSRLMRHEIDIGNQQADGKDLNRRMDHLDRVRTNLAPMVQLIIFSVFTACDA